ncbi:MAG: DUF4395 domain-containing protein [Bacteroidetes bacterium]|jgi:hypothetical protein|nr:DUF4395 domain-containing protein [Bacteroidota bacterium]
MSDNKEVAKLYVDEQLVRLIAAQVAIITGLSLAFSWIFPIFLLAADFGLRAFTIQPSPLATVARIIADLLKLKTKAIFAAPKKFAAAVGFLFALAILVLLLLNYLSATYILGGILLFFAVLESVFKICVGCYAHNWLVALTINKRNKLKAK